MYIILNVQLLIYLRVLNSIYIGIQNNMLYEV